ncbi:MAG TPA: allantoinase AllB [Nocardioidaceae bacterium]|nr:allantoinase AllB [Nocardioidaceae bacterium]
MLDVVLRARRAVYDGREDSCCVGVADGMIVAVEPYTSRIQGRETVTLGEDVVLLPGLVDSHVHVNDPGRAEWEGFEHATRAAAAGGVTTIVDMPLNSVPATVDVAALRAKTDVGQGNCYVDVAFWGGAVPGNGADLFSLHEAGVRGFKCFLVDSGVEEFPALDERQLGEAMARVASFGGLLLVHAEDPDAVTPAPAGTSYQGFLDSRPDAAEVSAIETVVDCARRTGCRVHVVHLSSALSLPVLRAARAEGLPITAETCPHYLTLAAEHIAARATAFKCCPPIRDEQNRLGLWEGLADRTIDMVVSDHSPCTAELKCLDTGRFDQAWGGISSLQLSLPVLWTEARERGHGLVEMARWMSGAPAARAGLGRKGRIDLGADADFCVLAPDEGFVVDPARLQHRHPVTPYAGLRLHGVVRETWLAGSRIDAAAPPRGRLLTRGGS